MSKTLRPTLLLPAVLLFAFATQTSFAQTGVCSKSSVIDPAIIAAGGAGSCVPDGAYISPSALASDIVNRCATSDNCSSCVRRNAEQIISVLTFLQRGKYLGITAVRDFKLSIKTLVSQACPRGGEDKPIPKTPEPGTTPGSDPEKPTPTPPAAETPKPIQSPKPGDGPAPKPSVAPPAKKTTYAEFVTIFAQNCPSAGKPADSGEASRPWNGTTTEPCAERNACINNVAKYGVDRGFFEKNESFYKAVIDSRLLSCNGK